MAFRGWRGMLTGALAIVALETIVQPDASGRVAGLLDDFTGFATKILDPTKPGISAKPKEDKQEGGLGGLRVPGLGMTLGDFGDLIPKGPITGIPFFPIGTPAGGSQYPVV